MKLIDSSSKIFIVYFYFILSASSFAQVVNLDTVYVYSESFSASNEMRKQAISDINEGKIYLYIYGYVILTVNKSKLDSLTHEYGFEYKMGGCVHLPGAKAYEDEVMKYLNKRNGEGWWELFLKEESKLKDEIPPLPKSK